MTFENIVKKVENAYNQYYHHLTLHHTILTFNDPQERRLLKTFGEKKKMLVTSFFS